MMEPWRFTLLGDLMGFAQPWALLVALCFLLLIPVGVVAGLRRRRRVAAVLGERLGPALTPGMSIARPVWRAVLQCAGLALLGVALAQPQCGGRSEPVVRKGLDLIVALDASKSMLARDVEPDRISRARLELTTLLDALKGDRVGIVAFAGEAHVQCPMTSDYAAAKLFLRAVEPDQMPQGGTNVGDALRLSKRMLEDTGSGTQDRVVVLLSDGEDLEGGARAAAEELKAAGIRVFVVGIGSEEGQPVPRLDRNGRLIDFQKDRDGQTVVSRLDAQGLRELADLTGGAYFHAPRGVAIDQVVSLLDRMKKAEYESRVTYRYNEQFQRFGLAGLLLWAMGLLLSASSLRREGA